MNIFDIIIVQPIFNLLILLYALIPGGDFGVALIIFTIIVRMAMWPLIKKQLHQTRIMQKLQPQLAKIKKDSKGDKKLESAKMLELYKKHDVSPFRSIGILIVQLPIFIALYQVILIFTSGRDKIGHFTYDFLKNLPAIENLIADPSQFNERLFGFVDLTARAVGGPDGVNFILIGLALIAAYTQRVMSKQTMPKVQKKRTLKEILSEAANGKEASQAEINTVVMGKMVTFMPVFMFFIMINLPGALALYYAVSNLVAVIQQHIILNKDIEELEEIAEEVVAKEEKPKTSAQTREKKAKKANVTRIVAKDNKRGRK